MAPLLFRPPFPEYDETIHRLPDNAVSLRTVMEQRAKSKGKKFRGVKLWGKPKKMTSARSKGLVTVTWVVNPTLRDPRYEPHGPQIPITEEICREEADRLGLNYVVIRGAAHETRNIYENGRSVTTWDASSGQLVNKQDKADSHFTVWMGKNKDELLLQGHIYVVWDSTKFGGLAKMTDPLNQRQCANEEIGERKVAHEYWSLTKDELSLKSAGALSFRTAFTGPPTVSHAFPRLLTNIVADSSLESRFRTLRLSQTQSLLSSSNNFDPCSASSIIQRAGTHLPSRTPFSSSATDPNNLFLK